MAKCPICGKGFIYSFAKANDGTQVCSDDCKISYNKIKLASGGSSHSATSSSKPSKSSSFFDDDEDDNRPKSEAELRAEAQLRKEVDESDARFFDSIKKLFMGKKNKAAKELHVKLEEIEADFKIALAKGDKDEAGKMLRQLKHDSNLFVPNTNTSYNKYWAEKRERYLNQL